MSLQGYVHPDFWPVMRTLSRQIPRLGAGGAAVCIYHRGEKVVDVWGGTKDEAGTPWESNTVSLSYSTTKGVASTLLHILADRGLIDYDEPVAKYWPEFAQAGKENITVRQIMCHESGLYDIRGMIDHARRMLDWVYMTEVLAEAAPVHEPGVEHGYHGLTYGWLVGELIQRVSGRPFNEVLRTEIAEPLELDGLYIGLPREEMDRRASLVISEKLNRRVSSPRFRRMVRRLNAGLKLAHIPFDLADMAGGLMPHGMEELDFNDEEFVSASIPAANGMFTARSLAKMYALLANGGELDGVRLLSQETIRRATEVQNTGIGKVVPVPMHWRLGYHRAFTPRGGVPGSFGHFGFGGSGAWADPVRNMSVAMVLNSGVGTPFGDLRIVQISGAACQVADRR